MNRGENPLLKIRPRFLQALYLSQNSKHIPLKALFKDVSGIYHKYPVKI